MAESINELIKYLHIGSRLDLKDYALTQILGLTGTNEGIDLILAIPEVLVNLISLLDDNNATVSKESSLSLVNISAQSKGAAALCNLDIKAFHKTKLLKPPENIVATTLKFILDKESHISDPCCMILSNLSRNSELVEKVIDAVESSGATFDSLISAFTKNNYNKKGANLHYLGPVLSNLSQSNTVRKYILSREKCVVQRLIAFTEYKDSVVRRGGIVGTLKNCCFDTEYHEWLLGPEVDILPRLLLPLAGNEEFDDEDNEKLPEELQYLTEDKVREEDPDIRCILLEAITQLCAVRKNREFVRNKNTYIILRELHKWEKDKAALLACENLVDILIRTEEEISQDNLKDLEVPADLTEKFIKEDTDYLADS